VRNGKAGADGNGESKTPEPSEFERFDALARQVISAPKAEVEKREKAYQRRRARRRAHTHGR